MTMACCAGCAVGTPCRSMQGMGGVLPNLVWPGDVDDYVARLDPQMRTTDRTVALCTQLPTATAHAWRDFFASWLEFKKTASCFFGCGGKFDTAQKFEAELAQWQTLIQQGGCTLSAPQVSAPQEDTAIKWLAAAVIVGAIAWTVAPLVRRLG